MHSFLDSKLMAKALRAALAERQIDVTHSQSLELVARQFGVANWNILAAQIEAANGRQPALPPGWFRTGTSNTTLHRSGTDPEHPGTLLIESIASADEIGGQFASLGHTVLADDFRGGRVRLNVELMGEGCTGASIWMRVDGEAQQGWLSFDNLANRAADGQLTGRFDWTVRHIVLEVPNNARRIVYGMFLIGTGRLWARNIGFRQARPDDRRTDYPRSPIDPGDWIAA